MSSVLVLLGLISSTVAMDYPGIAASLDISLIQSAKHKYFDYIIEAINSLEIPDIPTDDGHLNKNKLTISSAANDIQLNFDKQNQMIWFDVKNFNGSFTCDDFETTILGFIPVPGTIKAGLSGLSLSIGMQFSTQNIKGKILPKVNITTGKLSINPDLIDFSFGGSGFNDFIDQILQVIKGLFQDEIKSLIEDGATEALTKDVPQDLNDALTETNGILNLGELFGLDDLNDYAIDIQTPTPLNITGQYLGFGLDGTVFNIKDGEKRPQPLPGPMPIHNRQANSETQLFITNYFMNSIFQAFFPIEVVIHPSDIPESLPFRLDAKHLNPAFPGIINVKTRDGGSILDSLLDLKIEFLAGKFGSFQNNNTIHMSFTLKGIVTYHDLWEDVKIVDLEMNDVKAEVQLLVKDMQLSGSIKRVYINDLVAKSESPVIDPELDQRFTKDYINDLIYVLLPFVNDIYFDDESIAIPSSVNDFLGIKDVNLAYFDEFIQVGLTPVFKTVSKQLEDMFGPMGFLQ